MSAPSEIGIRNVEKTYRTATGLLTALQDISLDITRGEFVSVIGKSGCGKSTLLKIIGGLVEPSGGYVELGGNRVRGANRDVGFVFQHPVLLEWRTILENVLLPIEIFRLPIPDYVDRACELLGTMELGAFVHSYPDELSGGMQQRAAIARSLLYDPSVILLDEPFGALDALTREQMNLELLRIWQSSKKTIVFVTHDIAEAVFLSDRVVLLGQRPGHIQDVLTINLPRPRTIETSYLPAFADFRKYLRHRLG